MFDLQHANALKGEGSTSVGAVASNTELANLYDIKQALLRFVDYMEKNYPGNNLVLGITEVQHAGSQTMLKGTDAAGKALYVSNNYNILRQSIRKWDSFGNCEHVHYDTDALVAATQNLQSNLSGWEDVYGRPVAYADIQKVAVIIGGPTENASGTNGYGCTLPWSTFQKAGLNSVCGIRANNGTPNGEGPISWLEYSENTSGAPFENGAGTTFTEKRTATTEQAVYEELIRIAELEMRKKGVDLTAEDTFVDGVCVSDMVCDEYFLLDSSEPIRAVILNKDGSVLSETVVSPDDPNLTVTRNDDGTTTIRYCFGRVYNTQKCVLHFGVKANEDYIGSNGVWSNQGTPEVVYTHEKLSETGEGSGETVTYTVGCFDTPKVNVPIRFTAVDGETTTILVGEQVDLASLSGIIVQNAQNLIDNYDQINGTLSYVWVLPDGTEQEAGSVSVAGGSIGEQSFPDRSSLFTGETEGQYTATLRVTFTPDPADPADPHFSDALTAVEVNALTQMGNVWINVVSADSTERFIVRKEWIGAPPAGTDHITFRVLANGAPVTDPDGAERQYILSEENGWETEISGLPSVVEDVLQVYTVEEISCPKGYAPSYSTTARVEESFAAKVTLRFTLRDSKDKVTPVITYRYGGEVRTLTLPYGKYEKNVEYTFEVTDLPLNDGEPFSDAEFVSISVGTLTNSGAQAEKYLARSVSTEVKVITNAPAYKLPSTGGPGTIPYAAGGLLLISAAALLLYKKIKRRKEDRASF